MAVRKCYGYADSNASDGHKVGMSVVTSSLREYFALCSSKSHQTELTWPQKICSGTVTQNCDQSAVKNKGEHLPVVPVVGHVSVFESN